MKHTFSATLMVAILFLSAAHALGQPNHAWTQQLGAGDSDYGTGVAADGLSNVYLCGSTFNSLEPGRIPTPLDPYLAKYNSAGVQQWVRQPLGHLDWSEEANGVAADNLGNIWMVGHVEDGYDIYDGFIFQYDGSGSLVHERYISTSALDNARDVAADGAGNAYVVGSTSGALTGSNLGSTDVYVAKYNNGDRLWVRQFGTADMDDALGVACDAEGNVYVTGSYRVDYGGVHRPDVFVNKYNSSGGLEWSQQFGTQWSEVGTSIACDDLGNVFVGGYTTGHFFTQSAGENDAFMMKLSAVDGGLHWGGQFGTSEDDRINGVDTDAGGSAYFCGATDGDLASTNMGYSDIFNGQYDQWGNMVWLEQYGTNWFDSNNGVSVDGSVVYFGGDSGGLVYPAGSDWDAHLSSYVIPEPATMSLMVLGGMAVIAIRRRRSA